MFENENAIPEDFLTQKILIIAGLSFLGINYGAVMLLIFFIIFDTVFGVAKSVTLHGWVSINKERFWGGIITKIAILFIPISVALSGALLGFQLQALVMVCMYALIANDAISCYTNILSIKNKVDYENKDLLEEFINTLRNLIFNYIIGLLKNITKQK